MDKTLQEMHSKFRAQFPGVSNRADAQHIRMYGKANVYTYLWFESLAKALNHEMGDGSNANMLRDVFEFFRSHYAKGNEKIRDCIEVSLVENLFWNVAPDKARPYWELLPEMLKERYIKFHQREPA
jgi:hypothetical protein